MLPKERVYCTIHIQKWQLQGLHGGQRLARRSSWAFFWIFRFETFTDEENNFQRKVKVRYGRGILRFVGKQGRGKRPRTLRPERKNTKGTNCFTTACPHTNSHVKKIRVYSCRLIV